MINSQHCLAALAGLVLSVLPLGQGGVKIRKTLTEGVESYHVDVSLKMKVALGGGDLDNKIESTTHYVFKNSKPDPSGTTAATELTTTVEKMDASGVLDMLLSQGDSKEKAMAPVSVKGKIDDHSRFVPDEVKADAESLLAGSAAIQIFDEFPDKEVMPGDTWEVVIPKGPLTSKEDQKLTETYIEERKVDGKPVYVLALSGTLNNDVDTTQLPKPTGDAVNSASVLASAKIHIKGTSEVTGETLVDKATGVTLRRTVKVTTKQSIELPDLGDMKADMTGTTTSTMTLDK